MTTLMYKAYIMSWQAGGLCRSSRLWMVNEIERTIEMNSAKKPLG